MTKQADTLLIKKWRITIPGEDSVEFDTRIQQQNLNLHPDPPLGGVEPSALVPNGIASRVMVCCLPPIAEWADVTHEEPFLDATTGTVHIVFANAAVADRTIRVMLFNPHTHICPMDADTYSPPFEP